MINHWPDIGTHDVRIAFDGLAAWQHFASTNLWCSDARFIERLALHAGENGVFSHFTAVCKPAVVVGQNYRETIVSDGLNSRQRGTLDEVFAEVGDDFSKRILILEAITPFALALRGRYPFALGVEYLPDQKDKDRFFPVPHLDMLSTNLPDGAFDVVVSNDVLEHVPDLARGLRETRRILKSGGACIATVPFRFEFQETSIRAVVADGKIVHLVEPEFHGNPVDPQGSLVFQVPGWDILDTCRSAGFSEAAMYFVSSATRGLTGSRCAGIFVLRARA